MWRTITDYVDRLKASTAAAARTGLYIYCRVVDVKRVILCLRLPHTSRNRRIRLGFSITGESAVLGVQ